MKNMAVLLSTCLLTIGLEQKAYAKEVLPIEELIYMEAAEIFLTMDKQPVTGTVRGRYLGDLVEMRRDERVSAVVTCVLA